MPRKQVLDWTTGRITLPPLLTATAEGPLNDVLGFAGRDTQTITLDCSPLTYLDMSGVNVLIKLALAARAISKHLQAEQVGHVLRDIFRLTELDMIIHPVTGQDAPDRDFPGWAPMTQQLQTQGFPTEANDLGVAGRRPLGPLSGFGPLWEKTFQVRLPGAKVTPRQAVELLRTRLPVFQPSQNRFYTTPAGIAPGEVLIINADTPGGPIATGVYVAFADEDSFSLQTPEGHPEAGWVSFSAFDDDGVTVARVQGFARAQDPLYELVFRLIGSRVQDGIWTHVLEQLAEHVGVAPLVMKHKRCVDEHMEWLNALNLTRNAQVATLLHSLRRH